MLAGLQYPKKGKYHLIFYRKNKPKDKKTNVYVVYKKMPESAKERLGEIKWNGAFRKYWFLPDNNTGWSDDCLDLVSNFLKKTNKRYRNKLRRQHNESQRIK